MFTGIIEELGQIVALDQGTESARVTISARTVLTDAALGVSICVSGVCLTVVELTDTTFTADVMRVSLERSSLADAVLGTVVNLERALPVSGRFGGHVVQGHVDGTTKLLSRAPGEAWEVLTFALPQQLSRYLVAQGSITVDGVSLTVSQLDDAAGTFCVSLIPATLVATSLGNRKPGERVNLEVDVLAKYVERLVAQPKGVSA